MQLNKNDGGSRKSFRELVVIGLFAVLTGCATQPVSDSTSSTGAANLPEGKPQQAVVDQPRHEQLWDRLRAGYTLPELDSPLVAKHERWYSSHPEYMERMVKRARLYLYYIVDEVRSEEHTSELQSH